jgi:hypothetical protein
LGLLFLDALEDVNCFPHSIGSYRAVRVGCMYSSRKSSSRHTCVIISIAESPPTLHETDRTTATFLSPERGQIVQEKAIDMTSPAYGNPTGYLHEIEDHESLSDYAFMMEMEVDSCTGSFISASL